MSLLNWRRSARSADHPPVDPPDTDASPTLADAPLPPEHEVIRASTLADVPDWATLPPMAPSLPEMPVVVSRHFDDSLVSWQPPERFIDTLGHSVSPTAPSGIIEGMAVLSPVPEAEPQLGAGQIGGQEPLTLAIPPSASPDKRDERSRVSTRRLDPPAMEAPAAFEEPQAAEILPPPEQPPQVDQPPAPSPDVPVTTSSADDHSDIPMVEPAPQRPEAAESTLTSDATEVQAPSSDLVGSRPLAPVVQALVDPSAAESTIKPLIHARTPPDMPLAHLPTALMAEEETQERRLDETATTPRLPATEAAQSPAAETTAGLVGERAMIDEPADSGLSSAPPPPSQAPSDIPTPDLPLAGPPSAPASGASLPAAPLTGPGSSFAAETPEALLPTPSVAEAPAAQEAEPAVEVQPTEEPPAADEIPAVPVASDDPAASAPSVPPPSPVAPLLGQGPPIGGEIAPLAAGPEAASGPAPTPAESSQPSPPLAPWPRSGLGEPMSGLPATARSWDITTLTPAQQRHTSRALVQSELARMARGTSPAEAPSAAPAPTRPAGPDAGTSQPAYTASSGMSLQRAVMQRVESTSSGVIPAGLPPAGPEAAPLVSMHPLILGDPTDGDPESAHPAQRAARPVEGSARPVEGTRVRNEVGQRHGVDLSNVPLDRSPEATSEAYRLRARAFTSERGVVIPDRIGTLESGSGEALLAHELTHVAQRAHYGDSLPSESTPVGRLLEAEALAAEMPLRSGVSTGASPVAQPGGTGRLPTAGTRGDGAPGDAAQPLPLVTPSASGPDPESLAATILERMSALSTPAGLAGSTEVFTSHQWAPSSSPAPVSAGSVQRAAEGSTMVAPDQSPNGDQGHSSGKGRPSDEELSNLSRWLYPLIRYRLKGDLREDRERAGLLTDHYRRW